MSSIVKDFILTAPIEESRQQVVKKTNKPSVTPMPKMFAALIMPTPRSSTKWRILPGDMPTSVFSETRLISTASSAMSL